MIIVVPDPDALHASFAAGLRAAYGKLPVAGIPRMVRPRKRWGTVYGFSVVDVGGNWLRFSRLGDTEDAVEAADARAGPGRRRGRAAGRRATATTPAPMRDPRARSDPRTRTPRRSSARARCSTGPTLALRLDRPDLAQASLDEVAGLDLDAERTGRASPTTWPTDADLRRAVASPPMCEHFVARAAEPFRLDELWPFTERLERYGIAGFGWGAAWIDDDGGAAQPSRRARLPRRPRGRRWRSGHGAHDRGPRPPAPAVEAVDARPARHPAVRRPGRALRFSHNGDLRDYRSLRRDVPGRRVASTAGPTPRSGRAGSRTPGGRTRPVADLLGALHDRFGGQANLAVLTADGDPAPLRRQQREPGVQPSGSGRIGIVSTGIYSLDRSLFRFVAPEATDAAPRPPGTTVSLDRNGNADADVVDSPRRGGDATAHGGRDPMTDAAPRRHAERRRRRPPDRRSCSNAELLRLSVYWLGLVAVFVGIGVILQERIKDLGPGPDHPVHDPAASSRPRA